MAVSYHANRSLAKLVFVDEKLDAQRLLQWVDGSGRCEVKSDVVEWEALTMR